MAQGSHNDHERVLFNEVFYKYRENATRRRSAALAEVELPFEKKVLKIRQQLEAVLKKSEDKRNSERKAALTKIGYIAEELKSIDEEYFEKHRKFENEIQRYAEMIQSP